MTEFLVRHFVKDYEAVEKSAVRTAYGVLASMVGIVCNVFLFLVKFIVGLLLHSVSVTADAFNNLSDAASSIISFIGVMMAVFTDSMGDVITTSATILSLVIFRLTGLNIDGIVGIGVALVVMWAGVGIAKDTLEPLIGEAIDPEEYDKVKHFVERYQGIEGTHDLIIHNYGPNQSMASIHAEVPNDADIEEAHELIDRIERDAVDELGILLVIHMDPIEMRDEQVMTVRGEVEAALKELDSQCSIHDLRVVNGMGQINLIFDMVVPFEYDEEEKNNLQLQLMEKLQEIDKRYQCVITMEHSYKAHV